MTDRLQAAALRSKDTGPTADAQERFDRLALRAEIEEFFSLEADLVDSRRWDEWLALFSPDLHYRMPIARNLSAQDIGKEYLTAPLDVSWFDEDKATLETRVAQIKTGVHWAEEPLSRTAHLVTNVRVVSATPSIADAQDVTVRCKFLIYRNRNSDEEDTLIGTREDVLVRSGGSWLIRKRTIYVTHSVLLASSLSFLV
jgi:3-phenylpropionate/cinnamic acid dioxygenase small subunit